MSRSEPKKDRALRFLKTDIAAGVCFLFLAAFLFYTALHAEFHLGDEDFYLTIPQRLLKGDRLLVDEYEVSQLSSVFLILPYWLFTRLTGSSEGVVLYMRLLFCCVDLVLFVFYYMKLRDRKFFGLIPAAIFCADQYLGLLCLNYYSMCHQALAIVCMLLFLPENRPGRGTAARTAFAGFLFACAVLNQPGLIAVWAVYGLVALIRELARRGKQAMRETAGFINRKSFLFFTAGAAVCAAIFFVFLSLTSGWKNIFDNIPGLTSTGDYNVTFSGGFFTTVNKLDTAVSAYGAAAPAAMAAILTVATAIYFRQKHGNVSRKIRLSVFLSAAVIVLFCYISLLLKNSYSDFLRAVSDGGEESFLWRFTCCIMCGSSVPILFFATVVCLLCKKRHGAMTAFLAAAWLCSPAVDAVSNATVLFGGRLAVFPAGHYTYVLLSELSAPNAERQTGSRWTKPDPMKAASLALAVLILVGETGFVLLQTGYIGFLNRRDLSKQTFCAMTDGPYKGLVRSESFIQNHEALHRDLDVIRSGADGPLYVTAQLPYIYLYCDLPCGTYTSYYVAEDKPERLFRYWYTHPRQRPEQIFAPFVGDDGAVNEEAKAAAGESVALMETVCRFETAVLESGILLRVTEWDLPAFDEDTVR